MASVLAVVVSFHPQENTRENVQNLLSQVDHVVVVDNQSSEQSKRIFSSFLESEVSLIPNSNNRGVAEGFNQGLRWGLEKGYNYFLLMDQDSQAEVGMVDALVEVTKSYLEKRQLVLAGPHHEDFERKIEIAPSEKVREIPLLITSGSLLSRKLIDEIGLYDERLFIDHVDHDYCLRVLKMGGLCLKVNSAVLLHKFGEAKVKTFLGKSFFLQDYSPFRRYHMMRNRIVLYKRYGMFRDEWFWLDLRSAAKDLAKLVFFESGKYLKLKAILEGLWDGIRWKE